MPLRTPESTQYTVYVSMIRKMVRGGYKRKKDEWGYKLTDQNLLDLAKTETISAFVERQRKRYLPHVIRQPNTSIIKRAIFNADRSTVSVARRRFYGQCSRLKTRIFSSLGIWLSQRRYRKILGRLSLWQQHNAFVKKSVLNI